MFYYYLESAFCFKTLYQFNIVNLFIGSALETMLIYDMYNIIVFVNMSQKTLYNEVMAIYNIYPYIIYTEMFSGTQLN
jgi:hypothetical protein